MTDSTKLHPKKSLGQHFLTDRNIQNRIIKSCDLKSDDVVLEIGPGKGVLTSEIVKSAREVYAVEKDTRCVEHLKKNIYAANLNLINADFLKFPLETLPDNLKLIGNLPYNIASPIIEKIIVHRHKFKDVFIMLQLEHGRRVCASKDNKDYGSFTCFVQYYANPKILFKIKSSSFSPQPKVESAFIHLAFPAKPKHTVNDEALLFKIIRGAFQQRRKTIRNSLSSVIERDNIPKALNALNLQETLRAENLGLEDFIRLANYFSQPLNH